MTRILDDQRASLRVALTEGLAAGRNPRAVALDLIGRVAGGRRTGGIIGLNGPQMQAVAAARSELSDPARVGDYLARKLRDRRFDPTVRRAMRNGRALAAADVERIVGRYSDRLLFQRGETIARTETIASLSAGRDEGIRQVIDTGAVRADQVVKVWRATGDSRTRDSHGAMNRQTVGIDGLFVTPGGARMAYPGDTDNGAPPEETINCRCVSEIRIDFLREFQ